MTTASFDEELFARNLNALAKNNPQLAQKIRETPDDPRVRVEPARQGGLTLVVDDRHLLSRYDPRRDVLAVADREPSGGSQIRALIVLGFELGLLPLEFWQKTQCGIYVLEPDPGILRAALGAADLSSMLADGRFHIFDDVEKLYFVAEFGLHRRPNLAVYALPATRAMYDHLIPPLEKRIQTVVRDQDIINRTFIERGAHWFTNMIDNTRHFLNHTPLHRLRRLFVGQPAVIVSAGPSLDQNVRYLKEWKNRGVIISVGTALRKCVASGVIPDITIAIEGLNITDQFTGVSEIGESYLALCVKSYPDLWQVPAKGFIYLGNLASDTYWLFNLLGIKESVLEFSGSVSTAGFSLAAFMGCDPLVIIGQDLAFGLSGQSHASGAGEGGDFSVSTDTLSEIRQGKKGEERDFALVEGYHGSLVATKTNLRNYLLWFEKYIPTIEAGGVRVINATEGGAKIHGVKQQPFGEVTAQVLGDPLPVGDLLREHCLPDSFASEAVFARIDAAKKEMFALNRLLRGCLEKAGEVRKLLGRSTPPAAKINRLIAEMEKDEGKIKEMAVRHEQVLKIVAGGDLQAVRSNFDYQGLSVHESLLRNMEQTTTMHQGLLKAAQLVVTKLDDLAAILQERER